MLASDWDSQLLNVIFNILLKITVLSACFRLASAAFYFISHCLTSCFSLHPDQNGTVQCEAISCPPPQCPAGTAPAYVKGACCKECQREWSTLHPVTHPPTLRQSRTAEQRDPPPPPPDLARAFGRSSAKGGLTIDRGSVVLLSYLPTRLPKRFQPFAYTWTN